MSTARWRELVDAVDPPHDARARLSLLGDRESPNCALCHHLLEIGCLVLSPGKTSFWKCYFHFLHHVAAVHPPPQCRHHLVLCQDFFLCPCRCFFATLALLTLKHVQLLTAACCNASPSHNLQDQWYLAAPWGSPTWRWRCSDAAGVERRAASFLSLSPTLTWGPLPPMSCSIHVLVHMSSPSYYLVVCSTVHAVADALQVRFEVVEISVQVTSRVSTCHHISLPRIPAQAASATPMPAFCSPGWRPAPPSLARPSSLPTSRRWPWIAGDYLLSQSSCILAQGSTLYCIWWRIFANNGNRLL